MDRWRRAERGEQPGTTPGEPLCRATGQNIYYRAVKKSHVPRKGGIHVLRHSYATHLIESGVELTLVQRLLGHTSLLTTARYLHVTARRLDEVRSPFDLIDTSGLPIAPSQPPVL